MQVEASAFLEVELTLCEINLVVNSAKFARLKAVCAAEFEGDHRWCS